MPREFQIFSLGPSMAPPPQHSKQLNLCATNGQIFMEVRSSDQHPPNVPPVGLQPDSIRALDDYVVGRCDFQFNYGFEREKRLTEQDFLENLWNPTSVYVGQPQVVSTSLGLSLENTSKDSVVGFDCKLKRQDAEIDMIFKLKVDRLRKALLENLQSPRFQTFSFVEERIIQKLRQKEVEVEAINKRTMKLEEEFELLSTKVSGWEQRARYNGRMITPLVVTLRQIYAQNRASQEGSGDSEVVDDVGLLGKSENELKETMTCKVCRANKVSILLLPCKHLCLCKDCENKITICPICRSPKLGITEVYM